MQLKRLIIILWLCIPCWAALAHKQDVQGNSSSGGSATVNITPNASGNALFCGVADGESTPDTLSCSGGGLTWTQCNAAVTGSSNNIRTWWAFSNGVAQITVTGSGANAHGFAVVFVSEWSGTDGTNPCDAPGGTTGPAPPHPANLTPNP